MGQGKTTTQALRTHTWDAHLCVYDHVRFECSAYESGAQFVHTFVGVCIGLHMTLCPISVVCRTRHRMQSLGSQPSLALSDGIDRRGAGGRGAARTLQDGMGGGAGRVGCTCTHRRIKWLHCSRVIARHDVAMRKASQDPDSLLVCGARYAYISESTEVTLTPALCQPIELPLTGASTHTCMYM